MKNKKLASILFIIAGVLYLAGSIFYFIDNRIILGAADALLGVSFLLMGLVYRKQK